MSATFVAETTPDSGAGEWAGVPESANQLSVDRMVVARWSEMDSDESPADRQRVGFFVSHAGRDQAWAEWLAWQLIEAGYTVELDVWDWEPGQDFVARMQQALHRAERLLAVWSEAYFRSTFGGAERRSFDRLGTRGGSCRCSSSRS